jgi:hypothetical protein
MTESIHKKPDQRARILNWTITGGALLMIVYHVAVVWHPIFGELMNQNTHLGFCLVLIFLNLARQVKSPWTMNPWPCRSKSTRCLTSDTLPTQAEPQACPRESC